MTVLSHQRAQCWLARFLLACIACAGLAAAALAEPPAESNPALSLRARYAATAAQHGKSQFQRPLYLDSVESSRNLTGDIYALVAYPFAEVNAALNSPAHWCDVLILHINTKYCRASTESARTTMMIAIGKKGEQPVVDAYRVDFDFRVVTTTADYLAVRFNAAKGPLDTSDYRIVFEAAPADGGRTILHLTYSYAYGLPGRLAMLGYLATAGLGKVGFTVTGTRSNGEPDYIHGVRGVVERNTMRYFLAIDAYLGALAAPPPEQIEKRLQNWYAATEEYARQLHDVDRTAYVEMKRREYLRQQPVQ